MTYTTRNVGLRIVVYACLFQPGWQEVCQISHQLTLLRAKTFSRAKIRSCSDKLARLGLLMSDSVHTRVASHLLYEPNKLE